MYKISVVGPIPRDHITTHKGEVIEKYGCVTHPAIGLSRLMEDLGTVVPVSHIQKKDHQPILDLFSTYPAIDPSGLNSEEDRGDVISLEFVDQNQRIEKQTGFMNPILPSDIEQHLDSDIFVFIPITDYEVALDTLKYIKENSNALIIFDAHGPTNAVTSGGDRILKFWFDRDQWLPYIDILKMNFEESLHCWYKNEYEIEELKSFRESTSTDHLPKLAQHCLESGTKAVYITMDEKGCQLYNMESGQMQERFIKSVKVEHVVDTTGCGDSFAGGLAFGLLKDRGDYVKAAHYANVLGANRTQGKTFDVFKSLEDTDKMISDNYS